MRFSSYALPVLAANLVAALPRPQDLDFDLIDAAPDPTFTEAVGATAQTITIDPNALLASATADISSVSVDAGDVLSSTAIAHKRAAAATPVTCAPQPAGATSAPTYAVGADNVANFNANTYYGSIASKAPIPTGYSQAFLNKQASSNALGYLGFDTMDEYDVATCAQKCTDKFGCSSFNIYFERDPSLDPNRQSCPDPPSVTMIKCVYWGGQTTDSNTVNVGQPRADFIVAIAGSNGYVTTKIATPAGYNTGLYYGKNAINAPYDAQGYNTFMGSKIFTGIWNVDQCAAYCKSQSDYNTATAPKDGTPAKVCKFFNTYLLTAKMASGEVKQQGQYCSLYTEAWPQKYATNGGQWRGKDQYTIDYSFGYAKTDAGIDPILGDANGAKYQAVADIKWSSLQPFCSTYLGYTTPLSTVTATATITPVSTSTAYSTTTVAAMRKRDDTNSTYPGLSTDSSVGGAVLIDGNNVTWYSADMPATDPAVEAGLTKRDVQVQVPAGLVKYQSAVISAACSMQVKPASSTSVLTASATVTGPASITTKTVVATVTAQSKIVDNLIMTHSDTTRGLQGYPAGAAPLEFYGGNGSPNGITYANLQSHAPYIPYVINAHFDVDPTTGYLTSPTSGGLIACAYAIKLDSAMYSTIIWRTAAWLAANSLYNAPLICSKSQSGELSCSLTSITDSTVINSKFIAQAPYGQKYTSLLIGGAQAKLSSTYLAASLRFTN
ncbi:hypothetical protein E4T44_02799 [Aureobasidium sp. EXF-8845]|nr:hypothetical protein E4T44_02799 [Aureobasidium sp. EXF-8845]KAI4855959.1 hypothetical protein E4T45_02589 [Aureobasidium sp. EXF-8846]